MKVISIGVIDVFNLLSFSLIIHLCPPIAVIMAHHYLGSYWYAEICRILTTNIVDIPSFNLE